MNESVHTCRYIRLHHYRRFEYREFRFSIRNITGPFKHRDLLFACFSSFYPSYPTLLCFVSFSWFARASRVVLFLFLPFIFRLYFSSLSFFVFFLFIPPPPPAFPLFFLVIPPERIQVTSPSVRRETKHVKSARETFLDYVEHSSLIKKFSFTLCMYTEPFIAVPLEILGLIKKLGKNLGSRIRIPKPTVLHTCKRFSLHSLNVSPDTGTREGELFYQSFFLTSNEISYSPTGILRKFRRVILRKEIEWNENRLFLECAHLIDVSRTIFNTSLIKICGIERTRVS